MRIGYGRLISGHESHAARLKRRDFTATLTISGPQHDLSGWSIC